MGEDNTDREVKIGAAFSRVREEIYAMNSRKQSIEFANIYEIISSNYRITVRIKAKAKYHENTFIDSAILHDLRVVITTLYFKMFKEKHILNLYANKDTKLVDIAGKE